MTTKISLQPWAMRPFELIKHAEIHYLRETDYDRRLALISFDNSIEISITTYLSLKPIQRGGEKYDDKRVEKWLRGFDSKIDFFMVEVEKRGLSERIPKREIIWYHDQRNEQYHGSSSGVPEKKLLGDIRKAALWVFSILFDADNIETILKEAVFGEDVPTIPDEFVVPIGPTTSDRAKALAIVALLGQWNENREADLAIIRRLADGF